MHRISDFRVGGIARRNFSMFRNLCGDENLKNVVIVTNMWGEVDLPRGEAREQELRTDPQLFQPVMVQGAQMLLVSSRIFYSCFIGKGGLAMPQLQLTAAVLSDSSKGHRISSFYLCGAILNVFAFFFPLFI